jgi:integrase
MRPDGNDLRAFDEHRYWHGSRAAVDLPELHIHDLRHTGLTLAAQTGATLAEIMRRAGHSTSRAAMIYQHAAEDRDRELAARMSRLTPNGDLFPEPRRVANRRGSLR